MLCGWRVKGGMVWWQVKLCEPLYNTLSYLSALETKLLRLSTIQMHDYLLTYLLTMSEWLVWLVGTVAGLWLSVFVC